MDPSGDGGGGLTATGLLCGSCGAQSHATAKFCSECGTPLKQATQSAEYKQVTVLFADVVHSMDIAATVGTERLREIMTDLVNRAAVVVQRYGGTVGSFTGDGVMAVFGAPTALEDHAVRACLAALGVQEEAKQLAVDVEGRDGVELQLRIGLNSGQVIAGEIGSGPFGYTAVGEQVGMAQRMESIAPPGGVMLSASTTQLVEQATVLAEAEKVHIKGSDVPVVVRRLLGMGERHRAVGRAEATLVGRRWEMSAVESLLDQAVEGRGAVVGVVGPPGIGKSRLVREVAATACDRNVEVFTSFCESHTSQVPFHVVARLLRATTGVEGLDGQAARDHVRSRVPDADPQDLLLFDDLLGIGEPGTALPAIYPDARRRRLTAMVNAASLTRETPAVYVIEDAHWIDEVSESMLAEFLTVIPQTPSLVLVTYRPEYRGVLSRVADAQSIALAPLSDPETAALVTDLLGQDSSVGGLATMIVERAAGNPFFVEEMVRDLAERCVLRGNRSAYVSTVGAAEITVPATVQVAIAARIDRLDPAAKRTLSAGAVIGSQFDPGLLETLGIEPIVEDLVVAELVDQVRLTGGLEYVFHHPLIRTVAYESQLKSDRAELHRRVATALESRDPTSADEDAALIAEHWEAAGDLHAAYGWRMRAATWATNRDIAAARLSWERATRIADTLPVEDPDQVRMQISPLSLLCGTAWLAGGSVDDGCFGRLQGLCQASGDQASLAVGMAGVVMALAGRNRLREASQLASELTALIEAIGNPTLTVALLLSANYAKTEVGEMTEALRLAQRVIDLAEGDPTKGNLVMGSALALAIAMRGFNRLCLGINGWRSDADVAITMAARGDPKTHVSAIMYKYVLAVPNGALLADPDALRATADGLRIAEQVGDVFTLARAQLTRGLVLVHHGGPLRQEGFDLLAQARGAALKEGFSMNALAIVDPETATEKARNGDLDGAIESARAAIDYMFETGAMLSHGIATTVLVQSLLDRGGNCDLQEAQAAIDRLAAIPADPGYVLNELPLLRLRALLALAHGDEASYRDYRDRYRTMATSLGFEGHMQWAKAMP